MRAVNFYVVSMRVLVRFFKFFSGGVEEVVGECSGG